MSKSEKIVLLVNGIEKRKGRLVGLVDDEECRALINVKDAAKKVFTSESVSKGLIESSLCQRKRFVLACDDRTIYVSPKIQYTAFINGERVIRGEDHNEYRIKVEP